MTNALTGLALLGAALFGAAWLWLAVGRRLAALVARFRALPPAERALLALALAAAVAYGGSKAPTNSLLGASAPRRDAVVATVTEEDVARGWRVGFTVTNAALSYAMPADASLCSTWHVRGAYEDVVRIGFGDWTFPLGTNRVSSLWAYSWGKLRPHLRDALREMSPVNAPMSAVPGRSRLWTAETPESRLVTWEGFFLGRDTNLPVNAQVEIFRNGDFCLRSNAVETACVRVHPDDWDGDGVPNLSDPRPYSADADGWGPPAELPAGANGDAYCWIDLVVSGDSALVTFAGDGPSLLPDPCFMAREGETNRVTLLIGKTYRVTCAQPVDVVGRSDDEIETSWDAPNDLTVVWPVSIGYVEGNGNAFRMRVRPSCVGGAFVWTNSCCALSGSGYAFSYGCGLSGSDCPHRDGCSFTFPAWGYLTYEQYCLAARGAPCNCTNDVWLGRGSGSSPVPSAGVSFSKDAVVFEDSYTNEPGVVVGRRSTETRLYLDLQGGTNGGSFVVSLVDSNRLVRTGGNVPLMGEVRANERIWYAAQYEAGWESATTNDIVVRVDFTENGTGRTLSDEAHLTAVRVRVIPNVLLSDCRFRHLMGVAESFQIELSPTIEDFMVNPANLWVENSMFGTKYFTCPIRATGSSPILKIGKTEWLLGISLYEPMEVFCNEGTVVEYGLNVGQSGGIGMRLETYVRPLNVSFMNVKMMEVPSLVSVVSGYFSAPSYSAAWHHSIENGAGEWHRIQSGNFFFYDTPSSQVAWSAPWSDGTIKWTIPIGWGESSAETIEDVKCEFGPYYQLFTIDEMGVLKIDKFGQWVSRNPNGQINCSNGIRTLE